MAVIVPLNIDLSAFEPETTQAMSLAFDQVCSSLNLGGEAPQREAIALRIVALARRGVRNADLMRDLVLQDPAGGRP